MKTNKNGVKLLAVSFALMMAFAGIVTFISADGADADTAVPPESKFTKNVGTAIVLSGPVENNTYVFNGYVAYVSTLDEFQSKGLFEGVKGFAYLTFEIPVTGDITITQKNTALGQAYPDAFADNIKTKDYTIEENETYSFLIPKDGSKIVTIEFTKNKETITCVFDFTNVKYVKAVDTVPQPLTEDVLLTSSVEIKKETKVDLGKYTVARAGLIFDVYSDFELIADENGGAFSTNSVIWTNNESTPNLTVNGGTYYGGQWAFLYKGIWTAHAAFNCYAQSENVSIKNATIIGGIHSGVWFGNGPAQNVTIENCQITGGIGLYLGTTANTTVKNCNITGTNSSGVEVKSGTVNFIGGSISSDVFTKADGTINQNGSGTGEAALNINNGYQRLVDKDGSVSVTIDETKVTSSTGTPIQICAGVYSSSGEKNCPGNISFTSKAAIPLSELSIVRYSAESDEREISVNVGGQTQDIETSNVGDADGLEDAIDGKDYSSVTLSADVSVNADIGIAEGQTVSINTNENKLTATIKNFDNIKNKVDLLNIKGNFTISYGSIAIAGQFDEGSMTVYGTAKLTGNVVIAPRVTFTIASDATLDLNGYTLTNNGTVKCAGSIIENEGSIVNNGTFDYVGDMGLKDTINTNTEISAGAYLSGDLTIPEGVTLTIKSNGKLDMMNYNINVKGTLVIEKKGVITSTMADENSIILYSKGVIDNQGVIGDVNSVTITADGVTGSITMMGLAGVELSITKDSSGVSPVYYLTVSGDISKYGKDSGVLIITEGVIAGETSFKDIPVSATDVTIWKDSTVTIGSKASFVADDVIMQKATLSVDGTISGDVTLTNGSEVIINGYSYATYDATTGKFATFNAQEKRQTAEQAAASPQTDDDLDDSAIYIDGKIKGLVISVTTKTSVDKKDKSWTTQMLNISGDATYNYQIDEAGKVLTKKYESSKIDLDGIIYIQSENKVTLPLGTEIDNTAADYTVITAGTLQMYDQTDVSYEGAMYSVEAADDADYDSIVYYTTFDNAYAAIKDAENMTVYISGAYTFKKEYTVDADQTIVSDEDLSIDKNGKVTVKADGKIDGDFKTSGIKGILYVEYGGICTPADDAYEVKSVDSEKNTTYSGAEVAIKNATSGSTIYIVGAVEFSDAVTIPEGVTVDVADTASITAKKGLVVNGKIVNNNTITIADGYDLIVNGEIDSEDGTISIAAGDEKSNVTVNGKITTSIAITTGDNDKINAANYTDSGVIIYTTIKNAIETSSAMDNPVGVDVTGSFTEKVDVTLVDGLVLTIAANAEITVSSITLNAGSTLTVTGTLTTTVIAKTGTDSTTGAASDASVDVVKINGASFIAKYNEAKNAYSLEMAAYTSGKVIIKAGTVNFTASTSTTQEFTSSTTGGKMITVSEGATLLVDNNITIQDTSAKDDAFVNNGKIEITNGATFDGVILSGEVVVPVNKTIVIQDSTVAGTVTLSEKEGEIAAKATIKKQVLIGSTPETLGAAGSISGDISFDNTAGTKGYVIVFDGSTFVADDENIKPTKFTINGITFATAYGYGGSADVDAIVKTLSDLDACETVSGAYDYKYVWKATDGTVVDPDTETATFGSVEALNADIKYSSVKVLISAGPGMLVYIDDFQVGTEKMLTIGEHTVTVYLEPDYTGTATITFNGQTITNGKIVITTDMLGADQKLVVTGATPVEPSTPIIPVPTPTPSEKDDSMGITEYLLIVLVVLTAILVVVVAIRMMRS